jgi:predicted dehydrogenase
MRFLIAGLGSIGRRHLRNLVALGETDIILYRTHQSSLPDDELFGFQVETDLRSALARRPEGVVISNPTSLHLEVAISAARAGCHLLLEKPISHSLQGVEQLVTALQRGGGQALVGFQFRFHPGLQTIAGLLRQGVIGRVLSARAHWGEYLPTWHPWEDYHQGYSARRELGGGVILTLSHPLDYLRWLMGEVSALWAFAGSINDLALDVEDTAEIGMRFADGSLGSVHLDYNQRPPAHTLEIIGVSGTIRWDNGDGAVHLYSAAPSTEASAPILDNDWQTFRVSSDFERNHLFLAEMRHFLQVTRGEVAPVCTLQDGIQALRLALAAQESSREGKLVQFE